MKLLLFFIVLSFVLFVQTQQQPIDNVKVEAKKVQITRLTQVQHGILMTVSWCIAADLGIIFKLSKCIPYNIILHVLCFAFAIATSVFQLVRMNMTYNVIDNYHLLESRPKAHCTIAIMMVLLMGITVLMGIVSFIFQMVTQINPRVLKFFRWCHRFIGYFIVLLGKGQVILGWVLYHQVFAIILVSTQIAMILTFFVVYIFRGNGITQDLRAYELIRRPLTAQQNVLINFLNQDLPYNSLMLRQFNYFFFNDCLHVYKTAAFHPGGKKIINLIKGRDVDRFIYGSQNIQQYSGLGRYVHPQNSFDLISKPLMVLPKNPIIQLGTQNYKIGKRTDVSSSVGLFYLEPSRSEQIILRQTRNMRHVGQYFKVQGYGFTRLYSCVISMTDENRAKNIQILQKLNINLLTYQGNLQNTLGFNTTGYNITNYGMNLIPPQTIMNIIPPIQRNQHYIHQRSFLPLLIKKYAGNTLTSRIFNDTQNQTLTVTGLKGRGLGIERLNKGKVFLLLAGTGLFPFLDLFDALFKLLAGGVIRIPCIHEHQVIFEGLEFLFFGSFNEVHDMIIPTELATMASFKNPLFSMMLRITQSMTPEQSFMLNPYLSAFRFNEEFIRKYITTVPQYEISMIYICGPPRMYPNLLNSLRKHNVSEDKIFLL